MILPSVCRKISGMVLGVGVFFALAAWVSNAHRAGPESAVLFRDCLGIAVLGIFGTSWFTSKISFLTPIIARSATLIRFSQGAESGLHPNEVAGALIWVLPLMMTISVALFFYRDPPRTRTRGHKKRLAGEDAWLAVGWGDNTLSGSDILRRGGFSTEPVTRRLHWPGLDPARADPDRFAPQVALVQPGNPGAARHCLGDTARLTLGGSAHLGHGQ